MKPDEYYNALIRKREAEQAEENRKQLMKERKALEDWETLMERMDSFRETDPPLDEPSGGRY